jgi:uncharacterized tellurite resistance protein B-like protein
MCRGAAPGRFQDNKDIAPMFASIRKLFAEVGDSEKDGGRFDENDYRLAAAALLVHAARVDGHFDDSERTRMRALVRERFKLDDADADQLLAEASAMEQQAVDLYQFTARLNRTLDEKGRARVIEMMWQVVFADGTVSEFEDNLIWRAADLLHVPRRERIALRNRVADSGG